MVGVEAGILGNGRSREWLTFVHFHHFTAEWARLRLTDEDLRALELLILASPTGHPVVAGTGGLRKCRFAPPSRHTGKRGALRVGYVLLEEHGVVGLLVVYAKNEKEDLTPVQKKVIRQLIERFRDVVGKDRG